MSGDLMGVDELRRALRAETPPPAAPLDVNNLMRQARRRHRRRGVFAIGGVAVCAMLAVAAFAGLGGGRASTATPASGQDSGDQAQLRKHTALVLWATCLREADIPGVRVLGSAAGTDHIQYLDDHDRPLTVNTRYDLEEWGSAIEFCAAKVLSLRPELERQWGKPQHHAEPEPSDRRQLDRPVAIQRPALPCWAVSNRLAGRPVGSAAGRTKGSRSSLGVSTAGPEHLRHGDDRAQDQRRRRHGGRQR